MSGEPILSVRDLRIHYGQGRRAFEAVKGVSFDLFPGETLGLAGESGSGKTTIGRAIVRVVPVSGGEIRYRGERIDGKASREVDRRVVRGIQMIFQDPMASLNSREKVEGIVAEGLTNIEPHLSAAERRQRVARALTDVGLLPEFMDRFPHEFSGGQRQRIGIARALIMNPALIVADEPISALDVSIRAQVLNLLGELKRTRGLTYLFIAHDLSVMRRFADRIAVLRKGELVELADAKRLFEHPLHGYTRALISAVPVPNPDVEKRKRVVVYEPGAEPENQRLVEAEPGHWVRT